MCDLFKERVSRGLTLARKHPQVTFVAIVSLLLFLVLTCWWSLSPSALTAARPWIETLNGATWISDSELEKVRAHAPKRFAAAVALKTTFTFGGALGAILAALWVVLGGIERLVVMNMMKLFEVHDAELVSRLVMLLRRRHPNVLDSKDVEAMRDEAKRFLKDFSEELEGV